MFTIGIDPGTEESAIVIVDENIKPKYFDILPNEQVLNKIYQIKAASGGEIFYDLAIEMIASYGMPVGREVFETCLWIGRFREAWGREVRLIYRQEVKLHFCKTPKAKDPHVRQALLDRFGVVGTSKNPGFFHGFKSHLWPAFSVAAYAVDTQK